MNVAALKSIDGVAFSSLSRLRALLVGDPAEQRLRRSLDALAVMWNSPPYSNFVARPSVSICGVGGLLIDWTDGEAAELSFSGMPGKFTIAELRRSLRMGAGACALMTYLNPHDREFGELAQVALENKHRSILHGVHLSMLIAGNSLAIEQEISSQRDLIHLARLTVAKTRVQDFPPLTIFDHSLLELADKIYGFQALLMRSRIEDSRKVEREFLNSMWPAAKSSMILVSGSFRNLIRFSESGVGKEQELDYICRSTMNLLRALQLENW